MPRDLGHATAFVPGAFLYQGLTIGEGEDTFDPPFAVYVDESADPLRKILFRTALYLGVSLASVAGAVWVALQFFGALG